MFILSFIFGKIEILNVVAEVEKYQKYDKAIAFYMYSVDALISTAVFELSQNSGRGAKSAPPPTSSVSGNI